MTDPSGDATPIKSTFAGDPEMKELVEFFVEKMPERIAALEACANEGAIDELRSIAHQLKGAGGSYGFPQVTESARKLEETSSVAGGIEDLRRELDELVAICGRTSV